MREWVLKFLVGFTFLAGWFWGHPHLLNAPLDGLH
jgi:hypothetical protein